jgi:alpha-tubulin suppressor-like RCC1 family protein
MESAQDFHGRGLYRRHTLLNALLIHCGNSLHHVTVRPSQKIFIFRITSHLAAVVWQLSGMASCFIETFQPLESHRENHTTPHHTTKLAQRFRTLTLALPLVILAACSGGGGSNTPTTSIITTPDISGSVTGATRVVANKLYNYSATAANGATANYSVNWGDGTAPTAIVASTATQNKIWRAAGDYTASLNLTDTAGAVTTLTQPIAVVDHPVSTGNEHSCAILSNNTVACWGRNQYGQLGDGTAVNSNIPVLVPGLTNVVSLSAFGSSTCAAKIDGTVWCWGLSNVLGQVITSNSTPAQKTSLTNVVALSGGNFQTGGLGHICALQRAGTVQCWGSNINGELGNGATNDPSYFSGVQTTPVAVTGLTDAVSITAYGATTCAIVTDSSVKCWGSGLNGQVGVGVQNPSTTSTHISFPVAVPNSNNSVSLAMSDYMTCAVKTDGTVQCWGTNFDSQSSTTTLGGVMGSPTTLAGISNVASLSLGNGHACALKTDATVACWGTYYRYATNNTATLIRTTPVTVSDYTLSTVASSAPLTNVLAVSSGIDHTCALKDDGRVFCWGWNSSGQLGDGLNVDRNMAAPVNFGTTNTTIMSAITAGALHTCAITTTGDVMCWGHGDSGQLGNASNSGSIIPVIASGLSGVSAVAAGGFHTCALNAMGGVACWGLATKGQLGNASNVDSNTPVNVTGLTTGVSSISAGLLHTCALKSTGDVVCWGEGSDGQLGNTTFVKSNTPISVTGLTGVAAIVAGDYHTCALKTTGDVMCWGWNLHGQLGDASNVKRNAPVSVSSLTGVSKIAAGSRHTCALKSTGDVMCWGSGVDGQLGDAGNTSSNIPVSVSGLTGVSSIAAGDYHACALKTTGDVACWGKGTYGQLGNATNASSNIPVSVSGLTGVSSIDAGRIHSCALKLNGDVMCWGNGTYKQLGNPAYTSSNVPIKVIFGSTSLTFWK